MKRNLVVIIALCLFGCSGPNYKAAAIEYLKSKIDNPGSLDTVKFFKPDSIYTSFYDTKVYYNLKYQIDSLQAENNMQEAARLTTVLANEKKANPNKIVGWDVTLIYRAKDKKGVTRTDTCRFTFNPNLNRVKILTG